MRGFFCLLRAVVMPGAERLEGAAPEQRRVATMRGYMVADCCGFDAAFRVAHDAERMLLQLMPPDCEPACELVPATPRRSVTPTIIRLALFGLLAWFGKRSARERTRVHGHGLNLHGL